MRTAVLATVAHVVVVAGDAFEALADNRAFSALIAANVLIGDGLQHGFSRADGLLQRGKNTVRTFSVEKS